MLTRDSDDDMTVNALEEFECDSLPLDVHGHGTQRRKVLGDVCREAHGLSVTQSLSYFSLRIMLLGTLMMTLSP